MKAKIVDVHPFNVFNASSVKRRRLIAKGMTSLTTTAIRTSHIIAYDGREPRYLRDGMIIYEGNTIRRVGRTYSGSPFNMSSQRYQFGG